MSLTQKNTRPYEVVLNSLRRIKHRSINILKDIGFCTAEPQIKLIIVGAQKGGTTALYNYLSEHPNIDVPQQKELNFFNSCKPNEQTEARYLAKFPKRFTWNAPFYSIDTSPSYLLDAEDVAGKIHAFNPNVRIAAVLREPVSRAVSSWFMYKKLASPNPDWFVQSGWVKNNLKKSVKRRRNFGKNFADDISEEIEVLLDGNRIEYPIVEYGLYARQLRLFLNYFSRESIEILFSEDLKNDTQSALNKICDLSGIPTFELAPQKLIPHFVGDNKTVIAPENLKQLKDYYREENKALAALLGRALPWDHI